MIPVREALAVQILDLDATDGRAIDRFESQNARHQGVARLEGRGGVSLISLGASGVVGRHPAVVDQLFCVVDGQGWVSGADGSRVPVRAGQAVHWAAGEVHESGSESGMTALVVEIESCRIG